MYFNLYKCNITWIGFKFDKWIQLSLYLRREYTFTHWDNMSILLHPIDFSSSDFSSSCLYSYLSPDISEAEFHLFFHQLCQFVTQCISVTLEKSCSMICSVITALSGPHPNFLHSLLLCRLEAPVWSTSFLRFTMFTLWFFDSSWILLLMNLTYEKVYYYVITYSVRFISNLILSSHNFSVEASALPTLLHSNQNFLTLTQAELGSQSS